ncbi:MAG TPA: MmgE/PrpD family protein [Stellaceae bacterium]|nr:MmgE/PrpD family protein [Stellaceae bacterium]
MRNRREGGAVAGAPPAAATALGDGAGTVAAFVAGLRYEDLPAAVVAQAQRCLLDLAAAAIGGHATRLGRIVRDHVARHYGTASGARLMFDGRAAAPAWAAMANATMIDGFDSHDGHPLTKGHAGVAVLPGLLALAAGRRVTGQESLVALVLGYEIAIRAGIATHRTCSDYHTSGSWNALGVAAVAARLLGHDAETLRQALGIAEYNGPRSQMMRCIDHPTMVKDGSGWGALVGLEAALLAADGFTGAPALVVESAAAGDLWVDLGRRWRLLEQYFKPYPVCRWAHPAIEAALTLRRTHGVDPAAVTGIEIASFHEAIRLGAHHPRSTEEAQYSLGFTVAAALARDGLGPADIDNEALADPDILRLVDAIRLSERAEYNARFPAERLADVVLVLADGRRLASPPTPTRGDPGSPLSDAELEEKFRVLAGPALGSARSSAIAEAIRALDRPDAELTPLLALLTDPVADQAERASSQASSASRNGAKLL